MKRRFPALLLCIGAILVLLSGCAAKEPVVPAGPAIEASEVLAQDEFEDYGDEDAVLIPDPWEPWNRFWFDVNDVIIRKCLKPVWTAYEFIMPEPVRNGLSNAWHNLLAPVRILNRLLQGEFSMAWVEFDRFIVNTIFGGLGLGDVGSTLRPTHHFEESGADFGHTLAVWGVGEGIYCVWPILGPLTLRDTFGWCADYVSAPTFWAVKPIGEVDEKWGWIVGGVMKWNGLGSTIRTYEALTDGAVEPYAAVRDAYVKSRRNIGR